MRPGPGLKTYLLLPVLLLLGSPAPERGRWLAVLRDATEDPEAVARSHGGRLLHVYRHALRGFAVEGVDGRRLARDPRLRSVEADRPVALSQSQAAPPWGLDRVDQRNLPLNLTYQYQGGGAGVRAYVLDTGIRISHQDFGGRASYGYDFINNTVAADDAHGHGTHVAGTLGGATYGVAKAVSLVAVRVLDANGEGTMAGVIAGVDWVTANAVRPAVANMSLSGTASPTLDAAVQNSIASGVTYCVAAGNGAVVGVIGIPIMGTPQDASLFSPARVPEAVTVGATDIDDSEASFSNYGPAVKILAPGVNVLSSWHTSDSASATASGTSMASPHVAGAAALYLEAHPTATAAQVRQAILNHATPNKITGMSSPLTPNLMLYTTSLATASVAGAGGGGSGGGGGGGCGLLGLEALPLLLLLSRRSGAGPPRRRTSRTPRRRPRPSSAAGPR